MTGVPNCVSFSLNFVVFGLFWEKWLPFSNNFPEDPKKYQNQNFIPLKNTRSIPITLPCKSPPSRVTMAIAWKIKTAMTFLFASMLLWNHIRFIFTTKNFGRCDLSIYRLVTRLKSAILNQFGKNLDITTDNLIGKYYR